MADRLGMSLSVELSRWLTHVPVAVVTLHPVYCPDTLPFRSLTFSSDDDTVAIGRSSKSQNKNLVPLHNNGWFESRVMSRQHAVLRISMQKEVYLIHLPSL
jgi:hypothetical protein